MSLIQTIRLRSKLKMKMMPPIKPWKLLVFGFLKYLNYENA